MVTESKVQFMGKCGKITVNSRLARANIVVTVGNLGVGSTK